jgi:hypothetical protein
MSRKGAETQRDAHWFALTRWVNACLLASASSSRLCAFARHPIAGFRLTVGRWTLDVGRWTLDVEPAAGAVRIQMCVVTSQGRCAGLNA